MPQLKPDEPSGEPASVFVEQAPNTLNDYDKTGRVMAEKTTQREKIAVVGAGMVGVSTALQLQRRGADVTLVDRRSPGRETSYGNAGVITRSSLFPLNNPGLWRSLPKYLGNRETGLRYDLGYLLRNLGWLSGFLLSARTTVAKPTAEALDALVLLSRERHYEYLRQSGNMDLLIERGWMHLFRNHSAYQETALLREYLTHHNVEYDTLDAGALSEEMPGLKPIFARGLWMKDSVSVCNPGQAVAAYAELFTDAGGRILKTDVNQPVQHAGGWKITDDETDTYDKLVICAGPWSRPFLERMGYRVPMAVERGYHLHFDGKAGSNAPIDRPIYDTQGGYVLAPMIQGMRLTTGVELAELDAHPNTAQLIAAEKAAREAVDLGQPVEDAPWKGARPTLPDSRPAIGALPGAKNLYAAFGHQHIGFGSGPGTGQLLAEIMLGHEPSIDPQPFSPERFIKRIR